MEQKTFTIKSRKETFRPSKLNIIDLLALKVAVDFEDIAQNKQCFTFMLEHLEVEVAGQWLPVKEQNRNIYYPADIEEDGPAIYELTSYFLQNILLPVFRNSNE